MNWITRCPECATVYQVMPDQLQVAKAWVRCGHCQHAFDSTGLTLVWSGAAHSGPTCRVSLVPAQEGAAPQRLDTQELPKQQDQSILNVPSKASMDLSSFEQALSSFQPTIEKAMAKAAFPLESHELPDEAETLIGNAVPQAPIRRRWFSVFGLCALALALLAQWIWIERFAWTTRFPELDSHFQRICSAWACESPNARDLQGVEIDTSSFIQRDDAFELQWLVRNATEQTVLMTALEVTLEDVQGKPVVRRVFSPAELDAPKVLTPGQMWPGAMRLTVSGDTAVAGSRILSFYP